MNYTPPFSGRQLADDIQRIKELCNVEKVRIIHTRKTDNVTVVFECQRENGKSEEISFSPWNVKYRSEHFYLEQPILWFFEDKKSCYEDSVAFTLACMKALTQKGLNVDYAAFYAPDKLANELMRVYPTTYIEI